MLTISLTETHYHLIADVMKEWLDYDYTQKAGEIDAGRHALVAKLRGKYVEKAEMMKTRRERYASLNKDYPKGQRLVTMVQEEDGSVRQAIP